MAMVNTKARVALAHSLSFSAQVFRPTTATHICSCPIRHPHAESSSAPFRRHASTAAATAEAAEQQQDSTTPSTSSAPNRTPSPSLSALSGRQDREHERRANFRRVNARLAKQAMIKAKKLARAIEDERPQRQSQIQPPFSETDPESTSVNVNVDPSDSSTFWTDNLVRPTSPSSSSSPSNTNPTLDDLLSKKPEGPPPNPWYPRYVARHRELFNSIDSAFIAKQLRRLARELKLEYRKKDNKASIIGLIMDSWGWVEPKKIPAEEGPRNRVFQLPPSELFLTLRDKSFLERYRLDHGVEFSVVPIDTVQPPQTLTYRQAEIDQVGRMVLQTRGNRQSIDTDFVMELQERRKAIRTIEIEPSELHGLQAPVELLQVVSNAAGAFVEPLESHKYRITSMSDADTEHAKRLLTIAATRIAHRSESQALNAVLPVAPHFHLTNPTNKFSLYPFTSSLTESLPWDLAAISANDSFFRLKKVTPWTSKPARREVEHRQEDMTNCPTRAMVAGGTETNLRDTLQALVTDTPAGKGRGTKKVTVTSGHLLLPVEKKEGIPSSIFDSPLSGQKQIEDVHRFLSREANRKPIFAPSLTPAMIQYPISGAVKRLRRIQYRSSPSETGETKVLTFTYTHSPPRPKVEYRDEIEDGDEQDVEVDSRKWQDELGDLLSEMEREIEQETERESQMPTDTNQVEIESESESDQLNDGPLPQGEISAEVGLVREADFLLPDRPTDLRVTSTTMTPIYPDEIPESISSVFSTYYAGDTNEKPTVPTTITIANSAETYHLQADDELEIIEQPRLDQNQHQIDQNQEQDQDDQVKVIVRSVKVYEQGVTNRPMMYNELEYVIEDEAGDGRSQIPQEFWEELASSTRDVGPDAAALRQGNAYV